MTQSKRDSLKEVVTSTSIGFAGSWLITMGCLSVLTNPVAIATVTTLGCTVFSIVRGYSIRRYFDGRGKNKGGR